MELPSVADVVLVLVKLLVPVEVTTMVELCALVETVEMVEMVELPAAWVGDAVEGWVVVALLPPATRLMLLIGLEPLHRVTATIKGFSLCPGNNGKEGRKEK